jgi:hypothetical protein
MWNKPLVLAWNCDDHNLSLVLKLDDESPQRYSNSAGVPAVHNRRHLTDFDSILPFTNPALFRDPKLAPTFVVNDLRWLRQPSNYISHLSPQTDVLGQGVGGNRETQRQRCHFH